MTNTLVLTELVVNGTNTVNSVVFSLKSVPATGCNPKPVFTPINLSTVTRVTIELPGFGTLDSESIVDLSNAANGEILFALADQSVTIGSYLSTVIVYSPSFPLGQVLIHPDATRLTFKFV